MGALLRMSLLDRKDVTVSRSDEKSVVHVGWGGAEIWREDMVMVTQE